MRRRPEQQRDSWRHSARRRAEEYWTTAGSRIFNVLIDGSQVLTNFDIFATAGGEYKAVVEQFTETVPSSGTLTIQFSTVKDNAQVNGIEILS